MDDQKGTKEILDRLRRIETRFTKYLIAQGFDTQTQVPTWLDDGFLDVPSMHIELADVIKAIPPGWLEHSDVTVTHKGKTVIVITVPEG